MEKKSLHATPTQDTHKKNPSESKCLAWIQTDLLISLVY